ncbi:YbdD/YjiX family protein [Nocardioides humi]|uniref:YbdD/YjiX family protein n=1 Tax=Nocardioides humi TaxID=449461 RepID=A0ABN2ALH4_9ACTN|nr:YbdD/YjiX family protein [Nocardioides humi]
MSTLVRVWRGLRWYVREATGEARWDEYVERCARDGTAPMTRRAWERHRADRREHSPQSRCC